MPHPLALVRCPSHVLLRPCIRCCSDFPVLGATCAGSLQSKGDVQEMEMEMGAGKHWSLPWPWEGAALQGQGLAARSRQAVTATWFHLTVQGVSVATGRFLHMWCR